LKRKSRTSNVARRPIPGIMYTDWKNLTSEQKAHNAAIRMQKTRARQHDKGMTKIEFTVPRILVKDLRRMVRELMKIWEKEQK